ncbi:MAG TPA: hypothetical protein VGG33_15070, partial [Polyangia bacterium]
MPVTSVPAAEGPFSSRLIDRARRWVQAPADDSAALQFRRVFALIWLAYDLCDLGLRGTASQHDPFGGGRPPLLTILQIGLIAAQLGMALGRASAP